MTTANLESEISNLKSQIHTFLTAGLRGFWPLIKSLQTGLLLATGLAGYLSAHRAGLTWPGLLALVGSLALAVAGSTMLNMFYDRDIDAQMQRTCWRPLPTGRVAPRTALIGGSAMSALGIGWGLALASLYGLVLAAGWFFDVIIYTVWLKRRTPYSILIGGLAGGMPVLAGRVLAIGQIDAVGVMLALGVLLWIPTHILTFNMRHHADYQAARIPTLPAMCGFYITRVIIAASSLAAALLMAGAAAAIGIKIGFLYLLGVLGAGLLGLALLTLLRPSDKANFGLFKYASLYMLGAMIVIAV